MFREVVRVELFEGVEWSGSGGGFCGGGFFCHCGLVVCVLVDVRLTEGRYESV